MVVRGGPRVDWMESGGERSRIESRDNMDMSKSMMPTRGLAPRLEWGLAASIHHGFGKVEVKKGCFFFAG